MQKKLKRKDRGRGRGGNKGSDGFHEVGGIKTEFLMELLQMTACFNKRVFKNTYIELFSHLENH